MIFQYLSQFIICLNSNRFTHSLIIIPKQAKDIAMRVKEILTDYKLCVVDLEVHLNGETRNAPTLCVSDGKEVIPLNTADGRPILMNKANAIPLG